MYFFLPNKIIANEFIIDDDLSLLHLIDFNYNDIEKCYKFLYTNCNVLK